MYVIERFEGPEGDYSLSGTGKGGVGSLMRGQWNISAHLCTVSNLWGWSQCVGVKEWPSDCCLYS